MEKGTLTNEIDTKKRADKRLLPNLLSELLCLLPHLVHQLHSLFLHLLQILLQRLQLSVCG